ncbi:formate dehydrogenase accessory sulfurtransferase FdhD [Chloroflexota bacterium]
MDTIEKLSVVRISTEGEKDTEDVIVREFSLTIFLNGYKVATLLCSPDNLDYLAIGFLASEGLVRSKAEIKKMALDTKGGIARVVTEESGELAQGVPFSGILTSGCGQGLSSYQAIAGTGQAKIASRTKVSAPEVFALVHEFAQHSQVFKATGGGSQCRPVPYERYPCLQ